MSCVLFNIKNYIRIILCIFLLLHSLSSKANDAKVRAELDRIIRDFEYRLEGFISKVDESYLEPFLQLFRYAQPCTSTPVAMSDFFTNRLIDIHSSAPALNNSMSTLTQVLEYKKTTGSIRKGRKESPTRRIGKS